jgi:hypothetical protein
MGLPDTMVEIREVTAIYGRCYDLISGRLFRLDFRPEAKGVARKKTIPIDPIYWKGCGAWEGVLYCVGEGICLVPKAMTGEIELHETRRNKACRIKTE